MPSNAVKTFHKNGIDVIQMSKIFSVYHQLVKHRLTSINIKNKYML
jgi:hypothetical protein